MQIKEAAALCGLTEKAIRLYEEKGLISPPYNEVNGRKFRDYDEETVETLKTIAGLRQSFFSLEQIAAMQNTPEDIPAIFSEYRDELRVKFNELELLLERADAVIPSSLSSAEDLARALGGTLPAPNEPAQISAESVAIPEDEPYRIRRTETHAVPEMRFRVWDEDVSRDAREAAYRRYLRYAKEWERSYDTELKMEKLTHFWRYPVGRFVVLPLLCIAAAVCLWSFVGWRTKVNITYTGYEITFSEDVWTMASDAVLAHPENTPIGELDASLFPQAVEAKPIEFCFDGWKIDYLFRSDIFEGHILSDGFAAYDEFRGHQKFDDAVYRMELPGIILPTTAVTAPRRTDGSAMLDYSYLAENFGKDDGCMIFPLLKYSGTDAFGTSWHSDNTYIILGADSPEEASEIFWDKLWRSWQKQEDLDQTWQEEPAAEE